jgi:hypothetical protein
VKQSKGALSPFLLQSFKQLINYYCINQQRLFDYNSGLFK